MRVAVYLRQSEDRTGEEWGVDRQREDVMRLVNAQKWEVVGEFVDNDVSAYTRKPRPRFNAMMQLVEQGGVDVICAKHLDRLLRRLRELEETLERCAKHDTAIITTADGVNTSGEGGRLVARILASVAQGEVERKQARQRAAAKQAAEQGRWTGGRRPFGYTETLDPHPVEAPLVRAAYSAILSGRSLYSVAQEWNAAGVKTTQGNAWTGSTVRQMLIRPRYAGLRTYHDVIQGKGKWKPLIDETRWRGVEAFLTSPGRRVASTARKYLLSGILLCGKCREPMGSGFNIHPVYKCKHCGGVSRQMGPIDRLVTKLLLGFMASGEAQELLIDRSRADVGELRLRQKALSNAIDQIAIERADELLTGRQAKIATERLERQLQRVNEHLRSHIRSSDLEELVCDDPAPIWAGYGLDRRRSIIAEVVELVLLPAGRGVAFQPEHLRYRWLLAEE